MQYAPVKLASVVVCLLCLSQDGSRLAVDCLPRCPQSEDVPFGLGVVMTRFSRYSIRRFCTRRQHEVLQVE